MPNETTPENKNLQDEVLEDENVNIDDIEGLEKDITDEAPEEKKEQILYEDGPKLEDKLKAMEDSIIKEEKILEMPSSSKRADNEYIEGHAEFPVHDEEHDEVEILEHEHDEEEEEEPKESLLSKLKDRKNLLKVLIGILILLITIIVLIFIFLPADSEDNSSKEVPKPAVQEPIEEPQPQNVPTSSYEFKLDHINVTRVNKKLEFLTKYELLGMSEEEYMRQEQLKAEKKAKEEAELKERLRLEQEEKARLAKEEAERQEKLRLEQEEKERLEKELAQKAAEEAEENKKEATAQTVSSDENNTPTEQIKSNENMFLKFVHIPTYKKVLYKSELTKIKDIDARINPCRNTKNDIEIFIGPVDDENQYNTIVDALNQKVNYKNIKMLELTQEEFEERCMVY